MHFHCKSTENIEVWLLTIEYARLYSDINSVMTKIYYSDHVTPMKINLTNQSNKDYTHLKNDHTISW